MTVRISTGCQARYRSRRTTKLSDHCPTVTLGGKNDMAIPVTMEAEKRGSDSLERRVRRFYDTRQEAKQAKTAMRELAEKIGRCETQCEEPGECGLECYNTNLPKDRWCDICKQKLPLWENYHKKTHAASGALRALLNAARSLPPIKHD